MHLSVSTHQNHNSSRSRRNSRNLSSREKHIRIKEKNDCDEKKLTTDSSICMPPDNLSSRPMIKQKSPKRQIQAKRRLPYKNGRLDVEKITEKDL